jgi:hypothetical protein
MLNSVAVVPELQQSNRSLFLFFMLVLSIHVGLFIVIVNIALHVMVAYHVTSVVLLWQ